MPIELPGGLITPENWDSFVGTTSGALVHMIENGETPEFLGDPMTRDEAVEYLETWLEAHRATLTEAGVEFAASLVRRFAVSDEADETPDEFEQRLSSLTVEQLTLLSEAEADSVAEMKRDIIDRRRQLVADALEVGKVLLRGALATGLSALLSSV